MFAHSAHTLGFLPQAESPEFFKYLIFFSSNLIKMNKNEFACLRVRMTYTDTLEFVGPRPARPLEENTINIFNSILIFE